MPLHDEYARITPYELLLPQEDFADERFPAIRKEAEARGGDLTNPDAFSLLGEAGMVLRALRGEEEDPHLIQQHGALLFHAFHFWQEDRPLYLLETGVLRFLTDTGPQKEAWDPSVPGRAGYIQLPQHLVWGPRNQEEAAESVDGFFWSLPDGESLSLLLVMGIRKDRPGLTVVPLPTLSLASAAPWATMRVREEGQGEDFSSDLPGAELEQLCTVQAGAEAVKLAMRVFWYLDTFPGTLGPERSAPAEGSREADESGDAEGGSDPGPRPTSLSYRPVSLRGS